MHADYSESIDALERAVGVLKKQAADKKQASFTQLSSLKAYSLIPIAAKKAIDSFLSTSEEPSGGLDVSAPEALGYEFRSHGIIDMLGKLQDKFVDERTTLEKEEASKKNAYDLLEKDLSQQIDRATFDRSEKASAKAKMLQSKADAKGDLEDTTTTRDADDKYLKDLKSTCDRKQADFDTRQELRAQEIEAVEKAISIVSGDNVSGSADKHLPALLQEHSGAAIHHLTHPVSSNAVSFAQIRASGNTTTQRRVAAYLQRQAQQIHSHMLEVVAAHVTSDPFKKVKKMIKDLLARLLEEASEEAEHKGWCDQELSSNEQTRTDKTQQVEKLTAEIDQLEAKVAKLRDEIADLMVSVSELSEAMSKATSLRQEEKAKNSETMKDSRQAQIAVAQALEVLKEFYAKAAESTALVQAKEEPEAPEVFDKPYKGMQAESGGVIGMLELVESDFARLEADTIQAETSAKKEHDKFMLDSKMDKVSKNSEIDHKSSKKQDADQSIKTKQADLKGTQKELNAALEYFDKLKPSCVDEGISYEERTARRKEEVQSLQEALQILNGEDVPS